jgi:hypothetical protein
MQIARIPSPSDSDAEGMNVSRADSDPPLHCWAEYGFGSTDLTPKCKYRSPDYCLYPNGTAAFAFSERISRMGTVADSACIHAIVFQNVVIDPVVSLLISAVIVWGTWDLLRESLNLALQAIPKDIEPKKVERYLAQLPGIAKVHDRFGIGHMTLQLECDNADHSCSQEPKHVV